MAEKRVSVRLAAVNGRQVRAEIEGVGDAGAKGFGKLSREVDAANARLANFARRAGQALAAAAAAATTSLGLMVRATVDSAEQVRRFAQVANTTPEALQRWSAASRTVGIEQDKLADILKDVNDRVGDFLQTGGGPMADFFEKVAPRVGVTADQFRRLSGPEALQLYVDTLQRAGLSQQEMTFYLEAMASDATALLPLLRDGGAEMARLGDQAAALGAVLDAEALEAMRRTQAAMVSVSQVGEGLRNRLAVAVAPAVEAVANAFVALASEGGALRRVVDGLASNIGRIAATAGAFAALLAGRWVAAMAAAAASTRGLAVALALLRGAIIRTGIGALIVGAGELIYQFGRLVSATGGVGSALTLLGEVADNVFDGIRFRAEAAFAELRAGAFDMLGLAERAQRARDEAAFARDAAAGSFDVARGRLSALDRAGGRPDDGPAAAAASVARVNEALARTASGAREAGEAVAAAGRTGADGAEVAREGWDGVADTLSEYASEATDMAKGVGDTLIGAFRSAEDALSRFVTTGKLDFRDFVSSVLSDLSRLVLRQTVLGPLAGALGSAISSGIGGLFGGGAPGITGGFKGPGMLWANGGAFRAGQVIPFATGGVIASPTMFPMIGGRTGLMAEAGPEAIMPLRRGPGGRLGVEAFGDARGGGGGVLRIELGEGLKAQWLGDARQQSVEIVEASTRGPQFAARVAAASRDAGNARMR